MTGKPTQSGLPPTVIVQGEKDFWLRVETQGGVDAITLDEVTLPGARRKARELGHEPEAWVGTDGLPRKWFGG